MLDAVVVSSPRAFTKTIKWVSSFPWARLGKRPVSHQAIWRQEPRLSRRSQQVLIKQLSRRLLIQHHLKFIADHMSFPLHLPVLGIGDVFSAKRIMSGCFTSTYEFAPTGYDENELEDAWRHAWRHACGDYTSLVTRGCETKPTSHGHCDSEV